LKNAAQITAKRGDNTRVATIVAIELAASCIPFVKSNARATAITNHRAASSTVAQLCLRAMPSTMSETPLSLFTACSMASTMSFHRSTSKALKSPEKRCATVLR
jgi:hypothetical protein